VGIQLADWLSRLAKDFEVVVLRGGDMTELTGLKFDLFKGMSLPNGRVATIRYMGGYLREKIGFNFHQLVSCRVEVPQIAGTKRKHVPDEAEAEPPVSSNKRLQLDKTDKYIGRERESLHCDQRCRGG
jgi:hypothetical protein